MNNYKRKTLWLILLLFTFTFGCDGPDTRIVVVAQTSEPDTWQSTGYVPATDMWHVDFDDAVLINALARMNFATCRSEEFKTKLVGYLRQFFYGLNISFSSEPPPNGTTPTPGWPEYFTGIGANPYNTIAVCKGDCGFYLGVALYDPYSNGFFENNSGYYLSGIEWKLGVFIDVYAQFAYLLGDFDDRAKWLAMICAHEIGHSIGLGHDDSCANIMSSVCYLGGYTPAFTASHVEHMKTILPGPGR
ncbi:MAG: hypothetical protein ACYS8W_16065 [Planctomycetota bacterium]|jgi:hypothetical protein